MHWHDALTKSASWRLSEPVVKDMGDVVENCFGAQDELDKTCSHVRHVLEVSSERFRSFKRLDESGSPKLLVVPDIVF